MFPSNGLKRVSVKSGHGVSVVHIARHNQWLMYLFMLAAFTAAFLFFAFLVISSFFRNPLSSGELVLLFPIGFVLLWYSLAVRIGLWRAFGVEQVVIENGMFLWTRTALFWKRELDLPVAEITGLKTVTPWHDLSNHVEFIARSRRYRIGDMLRRDETYILAEDIRRATEQRVFG